MFAGLVALPTISMRLWAMYVALKGRPSDQDVERVHRSPFLGYGMTLFSLMGFVAILAYFWFADPASQTLHDWLSARNQPPIP